MNKKLIAILLIFTSGLTIMFYGVGNHGHFMFRPHMTQDWIIWGIVTLTGLAGLYLLANQFFNSKKTK